MGDRLPCARQAPWSPTWRPGPWRTSGPRRLLGDYADRLTGRRRVPSHGLIGTFARLCAAYWMQWWIGVLPSCGIRPFWFTGWHTTPNMRSCGVYGTVGGSLCLCVTVVKGFYYVLNGYSHTVVAAVSRTPLTNFDTLTVVVLNFYKTPLRLCHINLVEDDIDRTTGIGSQ